MNVLVLNAGSSSLKFRLLGLDGKDERLLARGLAEKWGTPKASLRISLSGQEVEHRSVAAENPGQAAEHAIRACQEVIAAIHQVTHLAPPQILRSPPARWRSFEPKIAWRRKQFCGAM